MNRFNQYLHILLFCLFSHCVFGQTILDKKIDFTVDDQSTANALMQLAAEASINISFSKRFFDKDKRHQFSFKQASVEVVLKKILKDSNVKISLIDDQVILARKKKPIKRQFTISGYIEEKENAEKMIAATVYNASHSKGTVSNEYGFYSITLPEGKTSLLFNYLGCQETKKEINLQQDIQLNIALERSITLAEVIVTPEEDTEDKMINGMNGETIQMEKIKHWPGIGGETDLVQSIQLSSGVQTGVDGFGGLYVRGGNADQNLMLLDGVPIYNVSHLYGLFSVFNTSAIRSTKLLKGGFSARYGGRLSSVFDVRTKEGNQNKWTGNASIGMISGQAMVEGPFANKKGAILLAARRTLPVFVLRNAIGEAFYNNEDDELKMLFYDINAKVNYQFSQKDRLFLSLYNGQDITESEIEEEEEDINLSEELYLNWGNFIASLRWNHLYNNKLFSNTTITYSTFTHENASLQIASEDDIDDIEDEYAFLQYASNNDDLAIKTDFDFIPNPQHYFRFGFGLKYHSFSPLTFYLDNDNDDDDSQIDSLAISAFSGITNIELIQRANAYVYIEDDVKVNSNWQINFGLRGTSFGDKSKWYYNLEPRLSSRIKLFDNWSMHTRITRMVQYLHRINSSGLNTPDDVWLPSSLKIKPQTAWQGELGLRYFKDDGLEFLVELYYKDLQNLLSYDTIALQELSERVEDNTISGNGKAYGFEVSLRKNTRRLGAMINYTLANTTRQYERLNLGNTYPHFYDRRHQVRLNLLYKIKENLIANVNWLYGSPSPSLIFSDEDAISSLSSIDLSSPGEKNKLRSKAFHRLDFSLSYNIQQRKLSHNFKLSISNLYNRSNPSFNRFSVDTRESNPVALLSFQPSLFYQINF